MSSTIVPTKGDQVARLRTELGELYPELVAKWSDKYIGMVLYDRKTDAARSALKTDKQRKTYADKNYARIQAKLLSALELRNTFPINAFEEPGVAEMMRNETLCSILPFTAQGVPILLYHYKRFDPSEYEATTHAAAMYDVAMIERAIALTPLDGPNRIMVVHDLSHLSMRDIRVKRSMLTSKLTRVLFPERVESILAFPAPFVLRGVLAVLRPLMPPDVTKRMKILGGMKAANKFFVGRGMTTDQLPTSLGGELEVVWQREESDIVLGRVVDATESRRSKKIAASKRHSKRQSKRQASRPELTKSGSALSSSENSLRTFP